MALVKLANGEIKEVRETTRTIYNALLGGANVLILRLRQAEEWDMVIPVNQIVYARKCWFDESDS